MAGGSAEDNPVPINVVPMVDVIFCLCVFFMCSFEFKQVEGAFAAWLPRNKGTNCAPPPSVREIRIALFWEPDAQQVRRVFGQRIVEDDGELTQLLRGAQNDWVLQGRPNVPLVIDGDPRVPWKHVVDVLDVATTLGIKNIEFAQAAGAPR